MKKRLLAYLFASGIALSAGAADYYVDGSAAGGGDGSVGAPFQTIQQAADIMAAGDTCHIRAGTYRETLNLTASGASGSEITYAAYSNEVVVISGLDQLAGVWTEGSNQIWSTTVGDEFQKLLTNNWAMVFIGNTPCVEARWPNMKYNENWIQAKKWAKLNKSSTMYGKLVCSAIGSSGIDFNGAVLQMKWLANTFASRVITNHTAGSNAVYYAKKDGFGDPSNIPVGGEGTTSDSTLMASWICSMPSMSGFTTKPAVRCISKRPAMRIRPGWTSASRRASTASPLTTSSSTVSRTSSSLATSLPVWPARHQPLQKHCVEWVQRVVSRRKPLY